MSCTGKMRDTNGAVVVPGKKGADEDDRRLDTVKSIFRLAAVVIKMSMRLR